MVKRFLLDTNAIIDFLQNNSPTTILDNANWIGVSIISILEFLSFPDLKKEDKKIFEAFLDRVDIVNLGQDIQALEHCIVLRKKYKLKLPDAIIAATAISNKAMLITADKQFFQIKELKVRKW